MKTHYENLGVKPDATEAEIKRAYRAKATEKHPDKGGSADEFAPIAQAYEVLKDPERRLLYDATGEDARKPFEVAVQNTLMNAFAQAIQIEGDDVLLVETVRSGFKNGAKRLKAERKRLEGIKKTLAPKRDRVRSSGPVNVVHMLIDAETRNIEAALSNLEFDAEVNKACLKALDDYTEDVPEPQPTLVTVPGYGNYTLEDLLGNRR